MSLNNVSETHIGDVDNLQCDCCRFWSPWPERNHCKCIDHNVVHFSRSCFSCDVCTGKHMICSAFEPVEYYPAIYKEWNNLGGFGGWHPLWIKQWHHGKQPAKYVGLIQAKQPFPERAPTDDIYYVPYQDFLLCNIMKPDGIHYAIYSHIERSRKSPIGYQRIHEGPGIIK